LTYPGGSSGITTGCHFIFVPLTLGLSVLVASLQTAWLVRKDPAHLQLTNVLREVVPDQLLCRARHARPLRDHRQDNGETG